MAALDLLAQKYVDLTLTKHQYYDNWDVYWLADTACWKRESIAVDREHPSYPYKPMIHRPTQALEAILDEAEDLNRTLLSLSGRLIGNEAIRLSYLTEHVKALITRTRFLAHEAMSYDDYTRGMFGLAAPQPSGEDFDRALDELCALLPGTGRLPERIRRFKEQLRIPKEAVPAVIDHAARLFHHTAIEHMGVKSSAIPRLRYREYGGQRMFVTVLWGYDYDEIALEQNWGVDYPFYLDDIREVVGHEMVPGHFTFMNLRTKGMVDTGYPELGLNSHCPSSAFIEGGARVAIELALDTPDKELALDEELFALSGADRKLLAVLPAWRRFLHAQDYAKLTIERRIWDGVWSCEQAAEYAREHLILSDSAPDSAILQLAHDEGHFTSHVYSTDVVRTYYERRYTSVTEKWAAYKQLCQYPFTMAGIMDGSFDPFVFHP